MRRSAIVGAAAAAALAAGSLAVTSGSGSSHREAPRIMLDPSAVDAIERSIPIAQRAGSPMKPALGSGIGVAWRAARQQGARMTPLQQGGAERRLDRRGDGRDRARSGPHRTPDPLFCRRG